MRHSVLIAGLGFLTLDRPDLGLRTCPVDELTKRLEAMQLPLRFLTVCVERYAQWAAGPSIGTYGANTTPESIVGRKMSKLVQANPSWTLVSMCNKKTAWRLHDWALAHYVPVQYVGNSESRVTNSLLDELVEYSSQIVVFEVRGGKGSDVVIKKTKAMRRVCVLELYRPEDMATGELPGTSTS